MPPSRKEEHRPGGLLIEQLELNPKKKGGRTTLEKKKVIQSATKWMKKTSGKVQQSNKKWEES